MKTNVQLSQRVMLPLAILLHLQKRTISKQRTGNRDISMEKLEKASRKWWFFVIMLAAQSILLPIVSRNFDPQNVPRMVSVTLGNAVQNHLGNLNILFQSLSLLMLVLLVVFKNKVRTLFNAYVAISYSAFAFIQNIAVTELYGFSVVTVNFAMFLFVAYVWIRELFNPENNYDFSNFHWKYSYLPYLPICVLLPLMEKWIGICCISSQGIRRRLFA